MNRRNFLSLIIKAVALSPVAKIAKYLPIRNYTAPLSEAFKESEGTIMVWCRVRDTAEWDMKHTVLDGKEPIRFDGSNSFSNVYTREIGPVIILDRAITASEIKILSQFPYAPETIHDKIKGFFWRTHHEIKYRQEQPSDWLYDIFGNDD